MTYKRMKRTTLLNLRAGMLTPMPTQLIGARFLATRKTALLADAPRCGKTGTSIIAADYILARRICIVTTASGRAVWRRAFETWKTFPRSVSIGPSGADVQIVSWAGVTQAEQRVALLRQRFDLLILDEAHAAKTFEAARTRAVYGDPRTEGDEVAAATSLRSRADAVWCLTGTPQPNSPADLFPMMRSLCPERLEACDGRPDVSGHGAFMDRYITTRPKKISRFRSIQVITGGRNLDELAERLDGFFLRRTQADVGIRGPLYETMPLIVGKKALDAAILAERDLDRRQVLNAAATGDTRALEMHLGPLRRHTGVIKAKAVIEAVKDLLDNGLDKVVLMAWHKSVIDDLVLGLREYGPAYLDGSCTAAERDRAETAFQTDPACRVFVGQILAAGEAIDLSAACELLFVETSFVPKDMAQAALRITNFNQERQAFVKVCTLADSIDDVLQAVLMRKWTDIREVMK